MGLAGGTGALRRHLVICLGLLFAIFAAGLSQPERSDDRDEVRTALPEAPTSTSSPSTTTAPTTTGPTTTLTLPPVELPPSSGPPPTVARSPRGSGGPPTEAPTVPAPVEPPSPTPSAPPSSPCDGSLPKSGGGQWRCTWSDEFAGADLDRDKWVVQETGKSAFHSGAECFIDSPRNVSVSDGSLHLTARREPAPFTCLHRTERYVTEYTSGMVLTFGKFVQTYGRFEVRAKLPAAKVKGLQTSFWLWPQYLRYGPWPASGEIDIAEWYSARPEYVVPYLHYVGADGNRNATNNFCVVGDVSQFHTYTLEWTRDTITILYDGVPCITSRWVPVPPMLHPQPFDQPFMIALTQALGIGRQNLFDPATTPMPATTQVDYVRVWE